MDAGPPRGRYDNLIPRAVPGLFRATRRPRSNFPPRYNVAPNGRIPIVRVDPRDGTREVVMARWGLIPFWMKEKPKVPPPYLETWVPETIQRKFRSLGSELSRRAIRARGFLRGKSEFR